MLCSLCSGHGSGASRVGWDPASEVSDGCARMSRVECGEIVFGPMLGPGASGVQHLGGRSPSGSKLPGTCSCSYPGSDQIQTRSIAAPIAGAISATTEARAVVGRRRGAGDRTDSILSSGFVT